MDNCLHNTDYEMIDVIWDDGERACWHCVCMLCGEGFEIIVTHTDDDDCDELLIDDEHGSSNLDW